MRMCRTYGSTVVNDLCTAAVCPPQAHTLAPSHWTEAKEWSLSAQTLADIGVIDTMIGEEWTTDLQTAKEKALLCPALLELVCEALESFGARSPSACKPVNSLCCGTMQQRVQALNPASTAAASGWLGKRANKTLLAHVVLFWQQAAAGLAWIAEKVEKIAGNCCPPRACTSATFAWQCWLTSAACCRPCGASCSHGSTVDLREHGGCFRQGPRALGVHSAGARAGQGGTIQPQAAERVAVERRHGAGCAHTSCPHVQWGPALSAPGAGAGACDACRCAQSDCWRPRKDATLAHALKGCHSLAQRLSSALKHTDKSCLCEMTWAHQGIACSRTRALAGVKKPWGRR